MKRLSTANGIAVNFLRTDRFKLSMLSLNLIVPIAQETAALNTLLLRVIKQGSANYPSLAAINTRLDDLYAADLATRNYKRGDMQVLGFSVDFLDNIYIPDGTDVMGGAIDMLGELLLHPRFDENSCFFAKTVEREKKSLCDAIRAQINNKQNYAHNRCIEEMCRDELFGLPLAGTLEEVEAITPQDLTARYHALLREARVEVFFIGSAKESDLIAHLDRAFAEYPPHTPIPSPTKVIRRADTVHEIKEEQKVGQAKLVLGFRTGYTVSDPDYLDFMVFCELYGGSPASKLFLNVREKLSLCYSCFSAPDSYKGLMFVSAGIALRNRDLAFEEIMAQLEAIRRGDFTQEEFDYAVMSLQNVYRQITDSPGGMEGYYLGRMLFGVSLTIEEMERGFAHVKRENVIAAANRITLDTVYLLHGNEADADKGEDVDDEE